MFQKVVLLNCTMTTVRQISTGCSVQLAKYMSVSRQGKIMGKLFGNRVPGSKKRWYPTPNVHVAPQPGIVLSASNIGKPTTGAGKSTTRRMTVLNKLFMKHITDLLATGDASEGITGRGLQVCRVKTSPDFACVYIYWLGRGDADVLADQKLEQELQRCSGILRHELSQLRLMGEVPRIRFVREKTFSNMAQVEQILENLDFGAEGEETEQDNSIEQHRDDATMSVKREFFGSKNSEAEEDATMAEHLPPMRHDVFGLNHRVIMLRILTKMRKSKQAWDLHYQMADAVVSPSMLEDSSASAELERVNRKITESVESADRFDKFLSAKRRERKNTPERKKHHKDDVDWSEAKNTYGGAEADAVLSAHQRRLYNEKDYIYEEDQEHGR